MWFAMLFWYQFLYCSPSVCLDDISLDLGSLLASFWERAANSVNHMFSLLCPFVVLDVPHLGFEGGNLVLITPVPGH